jgi:hypothetical protein
MIEPVAKALKRHFGEACPRKHLVRGPESRFFKVFRTLDVTGVTVLLSSARGSIVQTF